MTVDFTKMRKGSKPRGCPIDVCPKCGRKGERREERFKRTGRTLIRYNHVAENGGLFLSITDSCSIPKETK